jgi:hypothetical protein
VSFIGITGMCIIGMGMGVLDISVRGVFDVGERGVFDVGERGVFDVGVFEFSEPKRDVGRGFVVLLFSSV